MRPAVADGAVEHDGTGRVRLHFAAVRPRGPRSARCERLRRGQLERHRHRLDLRRSWHLQEVQGADRRRRGARAAARPALVHERAARSRLAARVPRPGDHRPRRRRSAACHPTQGSDRRRRPAGHPAAGDPEAVRRADRAVPVRPADRPGPAARRDRRHGAARRHPRTPPPSDGRATVRLQGDRGDRGRLADRRRAWGHDC